MSILATSPTNIRMFDASIAAALGDMNAALIVQQLNYWIIKDGVGTTIDGVKYVYNTFVEWVNQQFPWLSVWQFRKAMSLLRSLGIVEVIRHKAKQWNQTNFYTLNSDRLAEFLNLKTATSTEISELCDSSPQDKNNQHFEMRNTKVSIYRTKNTHREKQQSRTLERSQSEALEASKMLASTSFENYEANLRTIEPKTNPANLFTDPGRERENASCIKQNTGKEKSSVQVEQLVNKKWKEQIKDLDSAGIPVNKTLIKLLKSHEFEQVAQAIALFRTRKLSHYIPNPSGYFVTALKENWTDKEVLTNDDSTNADKATIFRHWYDLARELGYCSSQEVRNDEQWICLSGMWEQWSDAVKRGYSIDYLKKIIKRNGGER